MKIQLETNRNSNTNKNILNQIIYYDNLKKNINYE